MAAAPVERTLADGTTSRVPTGELLTVAAIVAAAFVARAWALNGIGINHFDEGVYVTSARAVAGTGELFPNQVLFSPPFYFGTVGIVLRLFGGAPDRVAILVNIVIGSLTVAALWWVGRAWFNARAAVIAATLLAFSQFHILFSRVALTDVAFAFWFLLALGAIVLAVDRSDLRLALLAGVVTGVAWNTKYHGWFALVITGAALVPTLWARRQSDGWRRPLGIWVTVCITAALVYVPWAVYMRGSAPDGAGYGGIVRYFADMLRGAWFANVMRHAGQQAYLEGALSRAAPLAAVGAALLLAGGRQVPARRLALLGIGLAAAAFAIGHAGIAALLALAALPLLLREFAAYRSRVLLCWVGLWLVAAPFYHPYPRLLLPFTIATLLLAGAVLDRWLGGSDRGSGRRAGLAFLAASVVLFGGARVIRSEVSEPWRPTRNHAAAAEQIDALVPVGERVHVLGEPSLAHYLRTLGRDVPANMRPAELDELGGPAWIVTGVYVDRAPPLRNRINRMAERLTLLGVVEFEPNDLRLLDDFRPAAARRYRVARDTTFDLTLYRMDR